MPRARKRTLPRPASAAPPPAPVPEPPRPVGVVDMGASSLRLVVAEFPSAGNRPTTLEEASRAVLLGKDTFTSGRIGAATMESALKALEGFRRIMDGYGVVRYRAVATSALREAANRDNFLDRVRLRTGMEVEIIDGAEENRLTYMAVREALRGHEAMASGSALLVEVGGGSADISFLRDGQPVFSGTYALGSIRLRQSLASWHGSHEQRMRLLRRQVQNVVDDIRREMPLREARQVIALGGDVRFVAARLLGAPPGRTSVAELPRDQFLAFCESILPEDVEQLGEHFHLALTEAETLTPALLALRELLNETPADRLIIPDASLRLGLLLDLAGTEEGPGFEEFGCQVRASAEALGEKYRYDAAHGRHVAHLATRLFDELRPEHGLASRDRLLLEVAALLHDVGIFIDLRGHHKHSQYILSGSQIFGLSRDDMAVISNVARYHRRALPARSHPFYVSLEREMRLVVDKTAAILRAANALDADHLQKVKDFKLVREPEAWALQVEAAGDLTMERLAFAARTDLFAEVFGRRLIFREAPAAP